MAGTTEAPSPASQAQDVVVTGQATGVSPELVTAGLPLFRADRMLESLRYAEYDMNNGIGELLDNAVEAKAGRIWVNHKREAETVGKKKVEVVAEVSVIDDGEGMSASILSRALVLGDSPRPQRGKALGIGRFGVGMTLGALSLARRIEVYSRTNGSGPFLYTYLDLDEVNTGSQTNLPRPSPASPPSEYAALLDNSSGTIVVLRHCDRLRHSQVNEDKPVPADEQVAGLAHWIGRTFRKFIAAGVQFSLDGRPVFLHDPLYIAGPTRWDSKERTDPRATPLGTRTIDLEVPGQAGKTAPVKISMSLLPREFRKHRFQGNKGIAKERRIDENEGISILRAGREVLYGTVPYITPKVGARGKIEVDRFWGCEIEFPPELDSYFTVRYIKRGAEPVPTLRKQIKDLIWPTVRDLRDQISEEFEKDEAEAEQEKTVYAEAENVMEAAARVLPRGRRGTRVSPEQEELAISQAVSESAAVNDAPPEEKQERRAAERKRLEERPYAIVPVRYPANVFFETVYLLNKVIVKLNMNHPFYKVVFEPLCGSVEDLTEESDVDHGAVSEEQRLARNAMMLLLLGYAQAEKMFGDDEINGETPESLFQNLRAQWGIVLGVGITKYAEGR